MYIISNQYAQALKFLINQVSLSFQRYFQQFVMALKQCNQGDQLKQIEWI